MAARNKLLDDYISKAPEFSKPVLMHFRELAHEACPDIEETLKWKAPHFVYKGIVCAIHAFKAHVVLNFSKANLMKDPYHVFIGIDHDTAGQFGKICSLADLPSDSILIEYIKEAVDLNENNIKEPAKKKEEINELPDDLVAALKNNPAAQNHFDNFGPGYKKEYITWLQDAKSDATRQKRLETAIEWISEGKSRLWKYKK